MAEFSGVIGGGASGTSLRAQAANRAALQAAAATLARVMAAAGLGAAVGLERVGLIVQNDWRRLLSQRGTGKVYGGRHQASSPGQPPARDTGDLVNSTFYRVSRAVGGPVLDVGSNLVKSAYLEFGTRKMKPRPSLRPAITNTVPKIPAVVAASVAASQRAAASSLGRAVRIGLGPLR